MLLFAACGSTPPAPIVDYCNSQSDPAACEEDARLCAVGTADEISFTACMKSNGWTPNANGNQGN
jgi:hypothetical protein